MSSVGRNEPLARGSRKTLKVHVSSARLVREVCHPSTIGRHLCGSLDEVGPRQVGGRLSLPSHRERPQLAGVIGTVDDEVSVRRPIVEECERFENPFFRASAFRRGHIHAGIACAEGTESYSLAIRGPHRESVRRGSNVIRVDTPRVASPVAASGEEQRAAHRPGGPSFDDEGTITVQL